MKKLKRAFTIVELVIVIAVIAILAAVLIPTFTSLIEKANESSDTVLAKNMNTILSTTDYEEDKSDRMTDTLYLLNENGYSLENMNPTADGNVFVWDSAANRIVYLDKEGMVIYSENNAYTDVASMVANAKGYLWVTVGSMEDIQKWSALDLYFSSDIGGTDTTLELNDSSLDTSAFRFLGTVKYGADAKNVSVYGSVAEMVIDSPNATVTNYSRAGTVTINQIADHSYHENGSVDNLIVAGTVSDANVVIEERGIVQHIIVESSAANVTNKGYIKEIDAQSQTITNQGGYIETSNNKSQGDPNPAEGYVLSIDSYKELALFRDSVNNGTTYNGMTVRLTADIDISGWAWHSIGITDRNAVKNDHEVGSVFQGTFDGQGHTINGLSNTGFDVTDLDPGKNSTTPAEYSEVVYGFFGSIYGATIKNVKLSNVNIDLAYNTEQKLLGDSIGALVGFAYSDDDSVPVIIENCQVVSGKIQGYDAVGGIMGRFYNKSNAANTGYLRMTDCSNAAEIIAYRRASGVLGYMYYYGQLTNCTNSGNVTSMPYQNDPAKAVGTDNKTPNMSYYYAAGIACTSANKNLVLTNCKNTGVITAEKLIGGDESKPRTDVYVSDLANCSGKDYGAL